MSYIKKKPHVPLCSQVLGNIYNKVNQIDVLLASQELSNREILSKIQILSTLKLN